MTEEQAANALKPYMVTPRLYERSQEETTLRAMYVQVVIDTFLCAVITVMVYTYWRFQAQDRLWTRALVVAATVMLYAVTIYLLWFLQYFLVDHFGRHITFFETTHFAWFPILDSICATLAQGYVAHRAWRLNGRSWILLVAVLVRAKTILANQCFLALSFGGAVWTKVQLDSYDSLLEALNARERQPVTLWLASVMGANILLTASVLRGLIRNWDQWAPRESYIARGARLFLESQLPATAVSIAFLVQIRVGHGSLVGSAFYGIQSNIYLVGLMYSLNGRVRYEAGEDSSMDLTTLHSAENQPSQGYETAAPYVAPYDSLPTKTSTRTAGNTKSSGDIEVEGAAGHMLPAPVVHGGRGRGEGDPSRPQLRDRQWSVGSTWVGSGRTEPKPLRH
ncbi:hypothetical protein CcaverHIS631_0201490 [Cutaneotrichosporon cavernicola]|nr:hypothetical protein CcaverHIS631_0201490 [Cutaneotrichosporon cavernicola]